MTTAGKQADFAHGEGDRHGFLRKPRDDRGLGPLPLRAKNTLRDKRPKVKHSLMAAGEIATAFFESLAMTGDMVRCRCAPTTPYLG